MTDKKVPALNLAAVRNAYDDDVSDASVESTDSFITGLQQILVLDGGSFQALVYHIALTAVLLHRRRLTKLSHIMASGPSALFAAHLRRVWPLLYSSLQRCVEQDRLQLIFDYLSKPFRAHYEKPKDQWVLPMRALAAWEPHASSSSNNSSSDASAIASPRFVDETNADTFVVVQQPKLTLFGCTPGSSALTLLTNIDGDVFAAALFAARLVETDRTVSQGLYSSVLSAVRVQSSVSGHGLHILVSSKTYPVVLSADTAAVTKFDTSDTEIFPMPTDVAETCDETLCDLPLVMARVFELRRMGNADAVMKQPHARSARIRSKQSLMATPRKRVASAADSGSDSDGDSDSKQKKGKRAPAPELAPAAVTPKSRTSIAIGKQKSGFCLCSGSRSPKRKAQRRAAVDFF